MSKEQALCHSSAIAEGQSKGFEVDGTAIFVVHKHGQFYAYRNQCPHLGIELEWLPDQFLDSEGALIQCATHGALFLIDSGDCIAGPCQGQSLTSVPCRCDEQGRLWVRL
ncbi:MFS transporter [Bacterioplanes sanyensis]|uniref:Rieske (2Fe-2S) protein n=1 Tax=Bacterioplanes sanyensis TaxID=1249553 RepID=UPI00167389BC|nr:Rieske (2Fe-2S) protein [Bacterioplanes sanyensis]GGY38825.1 MFS transporter [Bacterioplanes sanyensis]